MVAGGVGVAADASSGWSPMAASFLVPMAASCDIPRPCAARTALCGPKWREGRQGLWFDRACGCLHCGAILAHHCHPQCCAHVVLGRHLGGRGGRSKVSSVKQKSRRGV